MEITVFAKERKTQNGKTFWGYLATLTNKTTGEQETIGVRFRQSCGQPDPDKCPMNIEVDKADCNISTQTYVREDTGEPGVSKSLWVMKWKEGSEYVDHSTDDYF